MPELIRLSPMRDDAELDRPTAALRRGAAIVLPSAFGLLVAQSADAASARENVRRLSGHTPYLTLPSRERFERVFAKAPNPLLNWLAPLLENHGFAVRIPHPAFERGIALRFAEQRSVVARVVENAKVPVWTATFPALKGKPVSSMALLARLGGLVDFVVDDPFDKSRRALIRGALLRTGLAIEAETVPNLARQDLHFVCLGNLNRSAFAHHRVLQVIAEDRAHAQSCGMDFIAAWQVSSSGIIARPDVRPPDGMIAAARTFGLEEALGEHRSLPFTLNYGREADCLVPMSADVRDGLAGYGLREKMVNFGRIGEIRDPMGGTLDDYVETVTAVEAMLQEKIFSPACPI